MPGPFPLATLGPTITAAGITIPSYSDVYASLQASSQNIYGSDQYIDPDSQDGQMLAVFAKGYSDQNNAIVALYQMFSPTFAQDVALSTLVRINGLRRNSAGYSTAVGTVTGTAYTVINNGVVQDQAGNLWDLPPTVTIPGTGSISVTVTAQQLGAITAPIGWINTIYTAQYGFFSFANTAAAVPGAAVESDSALRVRQAKSVALPASSPLGAIYAAIGQLPGVVNWTVYQNDTGATDGNGVPSHSIDVIVEGGDLTQIAQTIQQTKSPGTGTYGGTTEIVTDATSGLPNTIKFDVLTLTTIYVSITLKALPNFVSTTVPVIQAAMAAFLNSLPIGNEVYYSQLYSAAQLDSQGLGATYYITALTVGTSPSPGGTVNVPIAFNAVASVPSPTTDVVITVT